MKVKRYTYLEIAIIFLAGVLGQTHVAFATSGAEQDVEVTAKAELPILPVVSEVEEGVNLTNLIIASFNPGSSNPEVREFFEIRKIPQNSISLAGLSVLYETSTGNEYPVYTFLDGDTMVGESLLLKLVTAKDAEEAKETADATYTRNMSATTGRLKLKYNDEIIDSLCWGTDETGCVKDSFKTHAGQTLVRKITEEEIGDFEFESYIPTFDTENPGMVHVETDEDKIDEEPIEPKCRTVEFSELLTYYEDASTEQFVELYNRGEEDVELDGCFVKYKNKNYALSGVLKSHELVAIYPVSEWNLSLAKNPASSNKLEIIDTDGETVDALTYFSGQKKGVSFAQVGYAGGRENWVQTYNPTPGEENNYQQFRTCPSGKVINLNTGNCVNETSLASATLAACPEGKYRNPLTGRCKSYETAGTTLKPCAEGYERNPETNRCRKIVENTGADYPVVTGNLEEKTELTAIYAIVTVVTAGIIYIIFQYREELGALFRKKRTV